MLGYPSVSARKQGRSSRVGVGGYVHSCSVSEFNDPVNLRRQVNKGVAGNEGCYVLRL